MNSTNIPICLQGTNIYLIFKSNILVNGMSDNFKLVNSFQREDDANEFISQTNSFETKYKVITHKMIKNSSHNNVLLWKEDLGFWILPKYKFYESSELDDLDNLDNSDDYDNFNDYTIVTVKDICNYLGLFI